MKIAPLITLILSRKGGGEGTHKGLKSCRIQRGAWVWNIEIGFGI